MLWVAGGNPRPPALSDNPGIETVDTYPLKICSDFLAESLVIQKL